MPLYEYRCPVDGSTREEFRSVRMRDFEEPFCLTCWDKLKSDGQPAHLLRLMPRVITSAALRGATVSKS